MAEKVLRNKSFAFAVRVVKVCRILQEQKREYTLSRQLIRSGTAVGALVREAEQAESRPDFVHKLAIGLKEATESEYWLELLFEAEYIEQGEFQSFVADVKELIKMLTAIIKTAKRNGGPAGPQSA